VRTLLALGTTTTTTTTITPRIKASPNKSTI